MARISLLLLYFFVSCTRCGSESTSTEWHAVDKLIEVYDVENEQEGDTVLPDQIPLSMPYNLWTERISPNDRPSVPLFGYAASDLLFGYPNLTKLLVIFGGIEPCPGASPFYDGQRCVTNNVQFFQPSVLSRSRIPVDIDNGQGRSKPRPLVFARAVSIRGLQVNPFVIYGGSTYNGTAIGEVWKLSGDTQSGALTV